MARQRMGSPADDRLDSTDDRQPDSSTLDGLDDQGANKKSPCRRSATGHENRQARSTHFSPLGRAGWAVREP
jgi:hypothetical protein